ncbi:MAG: PEP-CTERM sorting domain-containing protein, partial [Armatimonadota bacterium]
TIEQSIGLDGVATLSGYLYAGAHAGDPWRNCGVNVLWNGQQVATLWRDADPNKWASDFSWVPFSVDVTGTGVNTLKLEFHAHFAEWTWTAADDLSIVPVPEPSSILALSTGLIGLAGFAIRRRK